MIRVETKAKKMNEHSPTPVQTNSILVYILVFVPTWHYTPTRHQDTYLFHSLYKSNIFGQAGCGR